VRRRARNDKKWAGTSPAPTNECSGEVYPRLINQRLRIAAGLVLGLQYEV